MEYARQHKIPIDQSKKKIYSRDRNLWHISHEGADLEDPANEPKDDLYVISNAGLARRRTGRSTSRSASTRASR